MWGRKGKSERGCSCDRNLFEEEEEVDILGVILLEAGIRIRFFWVSFLWL
jgi:hypothetical protein